MNTIIICYQINTNSQNYDYNIIHKAISSYGVRAKAMNSVYFIKTSQTPEQVRSYIYQYMDNNDYIRCDKITKEHAGFISTATIKRFSDIA